MATNACFCDGSCKDTGRCGGQRNLIGDSPSYQWPYYQPQPTSPAPIAQQGWQCPVCKKVHAWWVASCTCHININAPTVTFNSPTGLDITNNQKAQIVQG